MLDSSMLFDLLGERDRRRLLLLLCEEESVTVPDGLRTRGATAREDSGAIGANPEDERGSDQLTLRLRHCHLPKLEEEGLVRWDREAGTVTRGPRFASVEPALELIAANPEKFPGDLL